MDKRRTTNILLLLVVIPVIFYLLKVLSFIFIPLVFSMFIALLFLPLMRWLGKRGVPKYVSIIIVLLLFLMGMAFVGELIHLSSKQIIASDSRIFPHAKVKLQELVQSVEGFFGMSLGSDDGIMPVILGKDGLGKVFGFVVNLVSMTLTTAVFTVLWLAESINIQKLMQVIFFQRKHTSVKTFLKIENDLITFIKVKFLVSLGTGIGIGLACVFFDVSFPIFWGLFAFVINFVQLLGSLIALASLSIFALVELDATGTLFFFVLSIILVEIIFGSILEPIFMGRSFSINIITVLVMLMFWGFIWGIPGMIMSIPITVFIKIILEQSPNTEVIANLLSGRELIKRK
ncbi:MAG: AI-2E family transporter [Aquaticitalea sp.]